MIVKFDMDVPEFAAIVLLSPDSYLAMFDLGVIFDRHSIKCTSVDHVLFTHWHCLGFETANDLAAFKLASPFDVIDHDEARRVCDQKRAESEARTAAKEAAPKSSEGS